MAVFQLHSLIDGSTRRRRSAVRSMPLAAMWPGSGPSASSSGAASTSGLTNTSGPHVSTATGSRPSSSGSKSPSSWARGALRSEPSRPYVHAWYGHCSVFLQPRSWATMWARWRQTFTNARISSPSRTTTTGM